MTQKTWFITGTSRGFGREWAIASQTFARFGRLPRRTPGEAGGVLLG
jgi:hypothetical protein